MSIDRAARFSISTDTAGDVTVARLAGELDIATVPAFHDAMAATGTGSLLVDLSDLEYMDSSGLRALIETSRARAGRQVVFRGARDAVARILDVTGARATLRWEDEPAAP